MRPLLAGTLLAVLGMGAPGGAAAQEARRSALPDTVFRHQQHRTVDCGSCHRMDALHGGTLVQSLQDCRSCHHTERARRECVSCHQASDLRERTIAVDRTLSISVHEGGATRALSFRHGAHDELACADCHTGGPSLSVPELDCQSCHEEHHTYRTTCLDCHREPTEDDHGLNVHATCSGSGCHAEVPVQTPPRTRDGCLWCHRDMSDHRPDQSCVSCHLMPAGGGRGGGGGASP